VRATLDWENLAEELEGIARKERQELTSHLRNLFEHCLKWQYADQNRGHRERSWKVSIVASRQEARNRLETSPSRSNPDTFKQYVEKSYRDARVRAGAALALALANQKPSSPQAVPASERNSSTTTSSRLE